MNAEGLSPFPNSDQFETCSYNAKSILLRETPVMEAQVHLGYLRFTDEIGITVCSRIPVSDLCLPSFKLHFLKESSLTGDKFHAFTYVFQSNINLIDFLPPEKIIRNRSRISPQLLPYYTFLFHYHTKNFKPPRPRYFVDR